MSDVIQKIDLRINKGLEELESISNDEQRVKKLNELAKLIDMRGKVIASEELVSNNAKLRQIEQDKVDDERRAENARLEEEKKRSRQSLLLDCIHTAIVSAVPFTNSILQQRGCYDSEREMSFLDSRFRKRLK